MEYIYAALLLHSTSGAVNEENITKVLTAAGVKPDVARLKALVAALSQVKIEDVIKGASSLALQPAATDTAKPAEAKKEEKKAPAEEKKGEEALAGLSALFG